MNSQTKRGVRLATALVTWLGFQYVELGVQAQETSPAGTTMDSIAWNCSGWHTVVSGDTCYSIEQEYGIMADEFLDWNPAVSADCSTNFWIGYSYCVRVGAPGPTLNGIAENCDAWHTVISGDSCYSIEQDYGITADEFLEWNLAVSSDCSANFWADYSYCVGVDEDVSPTSTSASATSTSTITSQTSTTTSISVSTTSVNTTTTPYSTRYQITSYNLTAAYTATASPPQHTLGGHPSYCNSWHQITAGETCQSIVNYYGNRLTMDLLIQYNPTIGEDCGGLYFGWYICVDAQSQTSTRVEWYTTQTNFTAPVSTAYAGYVATVVANFTASPYQTGIPSSCQNYYQAQVDDTCTSVLQVYNYITEDEFFSWNPALGGNCQGLWAGYYYCVANFDADDAPMPPTVTASASPTATGTISTCTAWYQAVVNEDCAAIAAWSGTFSEADFIAWNPSVWSGCENIQEGTYYCVGVPGTATTRSKALTTTVAPSLATQSGAAAGCTQYWLVSASDTCASIIFSAGVVNMTDFYAWNPAVGSDCAGLTPDYYVCVSTSVSGTIDPISIVTITPGVSTTAAPTATTTNTSSTSKTTSTGSTTTSAGAAVTTPTPYMAGMVDGCVRFYFRGSGDDALYCYDIAADAGIILSDFYTWNPQVGDDCSGLWADTWYCIGVSGPATTISSGVPTPAATDETT
ncbi:hypothetical protein KJ359_012065 [Pestalotiopsis sp. 9143b]|nr:hypothetical protein KJ359_012065 [Pestalotiopsis sp. 9143b]